MRRRLRGAALAVVAGLLLTAVPAQVGGAQADESETAADARAAAQRAASKVDALQPRVERALRAYERAVAQISGSVSRSVAADQQADDAAARATAQRRVVGNQVRALYMSGGSAALVASVLTAPTASDALRRVAYVQRLVETTSVLADDSAASAEADAALAVELEAAADNEVVTAADVTRRYDQLADALAEAGASLGRLSAHARTLAAAEEAAARLAAYAASADASAAARVSTARARADPGRLPPALHRGGEDLPWPVVDRPGRHRPGRVRAREQRVDVVRRCPGPDAVHAGHLRGVRRRR